MAIFEHSKLYNTNMAQTAGTAANIDPDDAGVEVPFYLYVGIAGDVTVRTVNGDDVLFQNAPAGLILPVKCIRLWQTGTTGTTADDYVAIR